MHKAALNYTWTLFQVMQDCGAGFSTIAGSNTSLQKLNRFANIMPCKALLLPSVLYSLWNMSIQMKITGSSSWQLKDTLSTKETTLMPVTLM